jgi:flagellar hook-associated protein 2
MRPSLPASAFSGIVFARGFNVSSPITMSGFNNIDFSTIINALMAQAAEPLTNLQTQQSNLQTQKSNFSYLVSRANSVQSAADSLVSAATSSLVSATSSDTSTVSATADNGAVAGHYDVVVQDLARAQVTASSTTAPDANSTIVATSGTLVVNGKSVVIFPPVTLQGLADAINSTDGTGVNAQVVQVGGSDYRLVLTAKTTGQAGAFTVDGSAMVDGAAPIHFDGTNAVNATDADVFVNNIEIKSGSNTLTDLVPGLSLTVMKKTAAGSPVSVDLAPDLTNLKSKANAFITAYNSLQAFAASQTSAAAGGDGTSIGRDPMFKSVMSSLRSSLLGSYGSGTFTYLAQIGIEFKPDGTLQMNDTVWNNAASQGASTIASLIGGDGKSGAIAQLSSSLQAYTNANGLFDSETTQLTNQMNRLNDQISAMTDRLTQQRNAMQAEFTAADTAMTNLKNQSGSLANFNTNLTSAS